MSKNVLLVLLVVAGVAGYSGYVLGVNKMSVDRVSEELKQEKDNSSEAVIEIVSLDQGGREFLRSSFVLPHSSILMSDEILRRAIENYDLVSLLGRSEEVLLKEIADALEVEEVGGDVVLRVKVYGKSEVWSERVSYAVVQTFGATRKEIFVEQRKESLNDKCRIQEDKVEDHRTRLYALSKKLQIPYYGKNRRVLEDESKEESGETVQNSPEANTLFGKVREDYERELAILDAIKAAEFEELESDHEPSESIIIHKSGWSDEVAEEMKLGE